MNFADLTDTNFTFRCEFAEDACAYWEYDFSIIRYDDSYLRNLSRLELKQLKENCEKILNVINKIQGGI